MEVNGVSFEVDGRDLARPRSPAPAKKPRGKVEHSTAPAPDAPLELNLVGRRVGPALAQLGRFLDAAMLAGLPFVRIVHGYGTGALQSAVHEHLSSAPVQSCEAVIIGDRIGVAWGGDAVWGDVCWTRAIPYGNGAIVDWDIITDDDGNRLFGITDKDTHVIDWHQPLGGLED